MNLTRITERVWVSDYEERRDRPALGYIRGDKYSVAVDAGHSADHLREFYEALKEEGLPLPELTVITHWHWDHSFAMHAVNGSTIANTRTAQYLRGFIAHRSPDYDRAFLALDPSIAEEYKDGKEIVVVEPDIVFRDRFDIDAGGVHVLLRRCVSPHTDDSTLVYVPEERVLFFGDARSGVFPTWKADPELLEQFILEMQKIDAVLFVGGHWDPYTKTDFLSELWIDLELERMG